MKNEEIEELSREICNGCQTRHKCNNNECCAMSDIVAEWLFEKGYRKIIPNVDFVVRAGDLVIIREKAIKDIIGELQGDLGIAKYIGNNAFATDLQIIIEQLKKEYHVEINQ